MSFFEKRQELKNAAEKRDGERRVERCCNYILTEAQISRVIKTACDAATLEVSELKRDKALTGKVLEVGIDAEAFYKGVAETLETLRQKLSKVEDIVEAADKRLQAAEKKKGALL